MSVNGWIDGKVLGLLQAMGVELPGGNGDTLRTIAGTWDAMGDNLTQVTDELDTSVNYLEDQGWSGSARDAFGQHWRQQKQTVEQTTPTFHQMADGLREYANQIDQINESIIDICVQIGEMEVAGMALSFFTGFLSDLVANTAVAAKVAQIVELVSLFSRAAEKIIALMERFTKLGEETLAVVENVLTKAAELSAKFLKTGLQSFATNFAADSGSAVLNQALTGQPITVSDDVQSGGIDALGTAVFTAGGATLAESIGLTGRIGNILSGHGMAGTAANGALGNVVGGLSADVFNDRDGSTIFQDAVTNAATGAVGNAQNHHNVDVEVQRGGVGGENRSDRFKLADAAYTSTKGTALNTTIYAAGEEVESDIQGLASGK